MLRSVLVCVFVRISLFSIAQWNFIGSAAGYSASEVDIEISPAGKLFMAIIDPAQTNRVVVKQYQSTGNTWINLGSYASYTGRSQVKLAVYNEQPVFVASFDTTISGQNIQSFEVKSWTGAAWNRIPIPGTASTSHAKGYRLNGGLGLWLTYFNKDNSVFDDGVITLNLLNNQQTGDALNTNEADVHGLDACIGADGLNVLLSEKYSGNDQLNIYSIQGSSFTQTNLVSNLPAAQCGIKFDPLSLKNVIVYGQGNSIKIAFQPGFSTSGFTLVSSGAGPLFDFDVDNNAAYAFTKAGNSLSFIEIDNSGLSPTVQTVTQGSALAPGGSTSLSTEVYNGINVVAYVSGQSAYVKELTMAPQISPADEISVCPGTGQIQRILHGTQVNFNSSSLQWQAVSLDQQVIQNGNLAITQAVGDSAMLTVSGFPSNSPGEQTTIRIVLSNSVGSDTLNLPTEIKAGSGVQMSLPGEACANDIELNLSQYASPQNGTWAGPGVSGNTFSPEDIFFLQDTIVVIYYQSIYPSGCAYEDSSEIVLHTIPEATVSTLSTTCGSFDGAAFADVHGGAPPYSYQWSSGSTLPLVNNLQPGQYQLTITDANHCRITNTANISTNGLNVNGIATAASCSYNFDGAIDLDVSGNNPPFSFLWSNGSTTEDIEELEPGAYDVIVHDSAGCQSSASFIVESPEPLTATLVSSVASTCGSASGSLAYEVSGGQAPYSYSWSKDIIDLFGETSASISGYSSGVFKFNAADALGCHISRKETITNSDGPEIHVDSIGPASCANDGFIYISSTDSVTFLWPNGATTAEITNLTTTSYFVTATNPQGCQSIKEIAVPPTTPLPVSICLASVDTVSGANVLTWDLPVTNGISVFNVYRETSVAGQYNLIGMADYSSGGQFIDTIASSTNHSWRYRIESEDNCGVRSVKSPYFKTMHLAVTQGLGGTYNLFWDAFEGFSYPDVHLYRYTDADGWTNIQDMPVNLFTFTDSPSDNGGLAYLAGIDANQGCSQDNFMLYSFSNLDNKFAASASLGLTENTTKDFQLFPNPSNGHFQLFNPTDSKANTTVLDQSGRAVYTFNCAAGLQSVDLSFLAEGIYNVRLDLPERTWIGRISLHY